jgi:hypothetical protein
VRAFQGGLVCEMHFQVRPDLYTLNHVRVPHCASVGKKISTNSPQNKCAGKSNNLIASNDVAATQSAFVLECPHRIRRDLEFFLFFRLSTFLFFSINERVRECVHRGHCSSIDKNRVATTGEIFI